MVSAPDTLSLRSPRPLPSPVCLHDSCIDTMCRNFHPQIFIVVTMAPAIRIGNYIYTHIYANGATVTQHRSNIAHNHPNSGISCGTNTNIKVFQSIANTASESQD